MNLSDEQFVKWIKQYELRDELSPVMRKAVKDAMFFIFENYCSHCTTNAVSLAVESRIVYLATPYTHDNPEVRLQRFNCVNAAAAYLIAEFGYIVYSPITSSHPLNLVLIDQKRELSSAKWVDYDEAFMEHCNEMIVLTQEGWQESLGVQREILYFQQRNRKITYLDPLPAWLGTKP